MVLQERFLCGAVSLVRGQMDGSTYTISSIASINQTMVKLIWKKSSYIRLAPTSIQLITTESVPIPS